MKNLVAVLGIIALLFSGCSKSRSMVSSIADLKKYNTVTIYDADVASFIELELEQLFQSLQYSVVGDNEIEPGSTMGVRYTVKSWPDTAWGGYWYSFTVLLEDPDTGRTLLTASAKSKSENKAWELIKTELQKHLGE